jgi:hypothetical protein
MLVHVLDSRGQGRYRVAIHTPMPAGFNSANKAWKDCWVAAGFNTTVLSIGTAPGQTDSAERTAILAGDVIEIVAEIPAESGGASSQSVAQMVNALITATLADLAMHLKYYGYTQ